MSDFDQREPHARAPVKEGLPEGLRPISMEGLSLLQIDDSGRLFWDGKPIEVSKAFTLTWWQKVGAVVAIVATAATAVVEWLQYFWPR